MNQYTEIIKEAEMLEEIRELLGLSIEAFVYDMDWPNAKYYHYIRLGRKRVGEIKRKLARPTIYKIFTGINLAIDQHKHWNEKKVEITSIVMKHLMPKGSLSL